MRQPPSASHRRSLTAFGLAAALCVAVGWLGYRALLSIYLEAERKAAAQRLDSYALSLESSLGRYESLPSLLALERDLAAVLAQPAEADRRLAANRYLETVQGDAAVAAAYVMDLKGETVAASNWQQQRTFVGQNYAYRPYFRDAAEGRPGRFYGIGATTGEPGYFLAAPLRSSDGIVGVVAVKVSLETFEASLTNSGDDVLVADADGVVFLASRPDWKYRTLARLDDGARRRLAATRQYGSRDPEPLSGTGDLLADAALRRVDLPGLKGERMAVESRPVGSLGWRPILLASPAEAERAALGGGLAAGFAAAFAWSLAVYLRLRRRRRAELAAADKALRRIHAELERRIAERTADLTDRLEALKRTEAILRETRDSAVQAGKLAVLGQMAAGITHELNQPLAALHTLSDNAAALIERGRIDEARENLVLISQTIGRTGSIIAQLKAFARKMPAEKSAVSVGEAIGHALLIVEPRRRELGARIEVQPMPEGLCVLAETVRIEQVLVNLIRNGLDAMLGLPAPVLIVSAEVEDNKVRIAIRDHGPGIAADALPHLFEPFYTTKPVGEGLGLGLAISLAIVEGFGGRLEARNAEGGAEFAIVLDAAGESCLVG